MMPPIVSVVGKANSGKTTLLRGLIGELKKRGFRIAVIKHAGEDFTIDTEGKDTWHFREAGAETVAISSARELAIMRKMDREPDLPELARTIGGDHDILLAEGYKKADNIKIEVHRREQGPDLVSDSRRLLAVVTDEPLEVAVPCFGAEDTAGIADLIEEKVLKDTGNK
jgi:molybdopterin-guanine dinucleotide biosynthesis adapter protein